VHDCNKAKTSAWHCRVDEIIYLVITFLSFPHKGALTMGIKRKVFYPLALSAAVLFSTSAKAVISPTAFKGVSQHYTQGHKFFSLTLGKAALESGFVYNLRINGNYTPGATPTLKTHQMIPYGLW
jgi:hypothetical protein